jgi:hypothetical protein
MFAKPGADGSLEMRLGELACSGGCHVAIKLLFKSSDKAEAESTTRKVRCAAALLLRRKAPTCPWATCFRKFRPF